MENDLKQGKRHTITIACNRNVNIFGHSVSQASVMNRTISHSPEPIEMRSIVFAASGVLVVTLTMTVTLLGDCLIYAAFYKNANLRTRANLFFLSLITADAFQALFVMPLELVRIVYEPLWPIGDWATKLWNSMFVCFGTASVFNLAAIGVERYIAISRPFKHHATIISKETLVGVFFVWIYAILSGICSFFAWKTPNLMKSAFSISLSYAIPLLLLDILIPLTICVVSYALIYRISLDHSCRIALLCGWTQFDGDKIRIVKERKSNKTLCLLVGIFMICSLPFFIFHAVDVSYDDLPSRRYASHIVKWLCYVNSACNWALYGFLNQEFREVLFGMVKKCHLRIISMLQSNRVVPLL